MPQVELSQLQLKPTQLAELQALLACHVPSTEVWAYGSRVVGTHHEGSDLDVVLRNPIALQQPVEGWEELKEALQQSGLPILVDVHQWAYLPTEFYDEICRAYVLLQTATPVYKKSE
ncbi:TPA: nucleotidyltransferase family protein [Aeromonas veronii]